MREVEVSRVVGARPGAVERVLTPERVVAAEGSFSVVGVTEAGDETVVTVGGPGIRFPLRFRDRPDGLRYVAEGEAGPFDRMETRLTVEGADGGARITARSAVSLNVPLPFADRVAAWKRRGELKRALAALAAAVE